MEIPYVIFHYLWPEIRNKRKTNNSKKKRIRVRQKLEVKVSIIKMQYQFWKKMVPNCFVNFMYSSYFKAQWRWYICDLKKIVFLKYYRYFVNKIKFISTVWNTMRTVMSFFKMKINTHNFNLKKKMFWRNEFRNKFKTNPWLTWKWHCYYLKLTSFIFYECHWSQLIYI